MIVPSHARRVRAASAVRRASDPLHWLLAGLLGMAMLLAAGAAHAREAPESFADLAERLLPAVVNVSTTQTIKNTDRIPEMPQFPPGSPFEDFFKEFFDRQGQGQGRPDAPPRKATSLGSGFIVDPAGYIVTNNHVIADAEEITVILHDETAVKAEIVGRDAKTDLALLKINSPKPLPSLVWGNSDESRVGDWVLAIGNPFGLGGTVTAGIISARARDINAGPYDDFIQTDAAINKGNSGGPLFNMKGEVVGVTTAIMSPSGGSIGIGFAIPSALAKPVMDDVKKFGKTRRGWLGVRIQSLSDEIAENLGLKDAHGALIASVSDSGPAGKGGVRPGDVILKFDGKDVTEMRRLPRIVAETAIGREVDVVVWRDGKSQVLRVKVGELTDAEEAQMTKAPPDKAAPAAGQTALSGLGFSVAAITPQLRERFNLGADAKGVVVTDVQANGAAAEKGLHPGDVVVEVSQEPVKSPAELAAKLDAARKAGRKSALMLVENEGGVRFIALRLDGTPAPAKPAPQVSPKKPQPKQGG